MANSILVQDDWTSGLAGDPVAGPWTQGGAGLRYAAGLGFIENSNTNFNPANTVTQDTGELYHSCEMSIDTQGTNNVLQGGPVVCYVDNLNFLCLTVEPFLVRFRSINGGGSTSFGDPFGRTHVDGDVYRLERSLADFIELYVNDVFAARVPIPSHVNTGTSIGVTDRSNGLAPNKLYGPLTARKVIPNLRSLRWRDIQRWSNATEGYLYNNFFSNYWVRLNQDIVLPGDFEFRTQFGVDVAGGISTVNFASEQNTNGPTNIRYTIFSGGLIQIGLVSGSYNITIGNALEGKLTAGEIVEFKMRRTKGSMAIFLDGVLIDERDVSATLTFNAFGRGQNTTFGSRVRYVSWVVQQEDNTIPVALLPAQREVGVGTTITNRSADGGPNASMVNVDSDATNQWEIYQEGDFVGLDATEQGQVIEPFLSGASGMGIFIFMLDRI